MLNDSILEKVTQIFGQENILRDKEDLICYGYDAAMEEALPECVVFPPNNRTGF